MEESGRMDKRSYIALTNVTSKKGRQRIFKTNYNLPMELSHLKGASSAWLTRYQLMTMGSPSISLLLGILWYG